MINKPLYKSLGYGLVSVLLLALFFLGALDRFEHQAQDWLYRDLGLVNPDIYVFGIDEETLIEFGPLQFWPRSRMAEAISILNGDPDWRPAVIAVDMVYSGHSDSPAANQALVDAVVEGGNVVLGAAISLNSYGEVKTFEEGRITADSLGEITMKGKKPVEIFALTGVL